MKSKLTYLVAVGVVALVFLAIYPTDRVNVDADTITLGAVISRTGTYEVNGKNTSNGYDFAIKRINANGGVSVGGQDYNLEIRYLYDGSESIETGRLANRLIEQEGIKFMLGPYSSELTKAVARVTEYNKIPMVAAEAAASNLYSGDYRYIFGLLSTCEHYMEMFIELTIKRAKAAGRSSSDLTLAIVVQNERFSLCIREMVVSSARNNGIEIVLDEKLPIHITNKDVKDVLKRVASKAPDILVVSGHSRGAEITVQQKREIDLLVPYIGLTHCEAAGIAQKYPKAAEGIYCPTQWAPELPYKDDSFGTAQEFFEGMKAEYPDQYSMNVPYQAASAAAAVLVWKDALERANDADFDTEVHRDALAETDLETFYGRIKFKATGQIDSMLKPMIIRQIQNSQFVIVN